MVDAVDETACEFAENVIGRFPAETVAVFTTAALLPLAGRIFFTGGEEDKFTGEGAPFAGAFLPTKVPKVLVSIGADAGTELLACDAGGRRAEAAGAI